MWPDGQIAAGAQQTRLPLRRYRRGLPATRRTAFGSLASICAGPLNDTPCAAGADLSAQPNLREARSAEFERLDVPAVAVELDVAAHVLERACRKRYRVHANAESHGNGGR